MVSEAAVMPPPWANPKLNPCASEPHGWQLLFWLPDGKCYKIFKMGYPCPDGMELSPLPTKSGKLLAECRCPPKTAQTRDGDECYQLFTRGPCQEGYYFAPEIALKTNTSKRAWGTCKQIATCSSSSAIHWPKDEKCYQRLTRGPCPKGQLLTVDANRIPVCACTKKKEFRDYHAEDGNCYQHFTKGPCKERGHLFLPDRTCGCHSFLPHFSDGNCYELGTVGPCSKGEIFTVLPKTSTGGCVCKPGNIRYNDSPACYRPFTRGPCAKDEILINATTCVPQPCKRGELLHPSENACFKIGTRGTCPKGHVFSYDFDTRPSVDGVSYNGVCVCQHKDCDVDEEAELVCDRAEGLIRYGVRCYKLYSRGPCEKGAWLVPRRQGKELFDDEGQSSDGVCECVPGHSRLVRRIDDGPVSECVSPAFHIADYLNNNYTAGVELNQM
ncbi:uncharacterized protein LOC132705743 isoform X2 [Cylas formicarius]|nr:uncharacterized protein LOC132705743 isoform X2 [Cylas formicarius]